MRTEKRKWENRTGGSFRHRHNSGWWGFNSFCGGLIEGEYDNSENDDYYDYNNGRGYLFLQLVSLLSLIGRAPDIAPEFQFIPVVSFLTYLVPLYIFNMSIQEEDIETILMAGICEVPGRVHGCGILVPEGEITPGISSSRGLIPIDCINEPAALRGAVLRTIPSPGPGATRKIFRCAPTVLSP